MNGPSHGARSLIERAAEFYDFEAMLRPRPAPAPDLVVDGVVDGQRAPVTMPKRRGAVAPQLDRPKVGVQPVDRVRLREAGFILPDAPVGTLAEEFRLVKRQLLLRADRSGVEPTAKDRMILVCSAQPNEGKTFCAVNLALSLASERDHDVLLVDADVAKPEVLSTLGLPGDAGLIDAIADAHADVERFIIQTDIPTLSVLPAGKATHNDTELLSSARAAAVIASLAENHPRRIVIIDSAPALAASPAAVLAHRVGRVLMVVRADRTTEGNLRDAVALLDGCPDMALLLNASSYFGTNQSYGAYYGAQA